MIDEKKLIEEIHKYFRDRIDEDESEFIDNKWLKLNKEICGIIYKQPKVGEWIPVSERLPEENGSYLCQINFANHEIIDVLSFATNLYEVDKWDFSDKKRAGFYDSEFDWGSFEVDEVIAWMPLLEPYRKDVE